MYKQLLLFLTLGVVTIGIHADQPLTFEERVEAQRAIERVFYSHRIWPDVNPTPKPPFEKMVPEEVIRKKVGDTLKKSILLNDYWQRPITADQLQGEMDRMVSHTRDPETLRELFSSLNNDPYLIAECLVRPLLADRVLRKTFVYDQRIHGDLKNRV